MKIHLIRKLFIFFVLFCIELKCTKISKGSKKKEYELELRLHPQSVVNGTIVNLTDRNEAHVIDSKILKKETPFVAIVPHIGPYYITYLSYKGIQPLNKPWQTALGRIWMNAKKDRTILTLCITKKGKKICPDFGVVRHPEWENIRVIVDSEKATTKQNKKFDVELKLHPKSVVNKVNLTLVDDKNKKMIQNKEVTKEKPIKISLENIGPYYVTNLKYNGVTFNKPIESALGRIWMVKDKKTILTLCISKQNKSICPEYSVVKHPEWQDVTVIVD